MTRPFSSFLTVLCGLLLSFQAAVSQSVNTSPYGQPYGGVPIAVGSIPAGPSEGTSAPPSSGVCPSPNPCVLTGQYDRERTSTNVYASSLAAFTNSAAATFGLAYLYQFPPANAPFSLHYEPMLAQPLYVTHVLINGTYKDLLIAATLADFVYAYDASSGTTSTPLWSVNLAKADCGSQIGVPFANNKNGQPGGVPQLPYYGIVSTPVVDTTPSTPILLVTSACTTSSTSTNIQWNIDALSLVDGTRSTGSTVIADGTTFKSSNQLSRASLLLTHPATGGNFVYVAFGSGASEIAAAIAPLGQYAYSGVVFGYAVTYSTGQPFASFSELYPTSSSPQPAPFYTSGGTTQSFPNVYSGYLTSNYPLGPGCATPGAACSPGSNWSVNNGGIWMSGKGLSSEGNAYLFLAAGNGAFGCNTSGQDCDGVSACTSPSGMLYWGESAIKFPTAVLGNPVSVMGTPADFFAPYVQRYVCPLGQSSCTGASMPNPTLNPTDPAPACYQTEELSRLDLDFGTSGVVLAPKTVGSTTNLFAMTTDKWGMAYVMPAQGGLGHFQPNDSGLNGSGLTYSTQLPFQLPRYPTFANPLCESINSTGTNITGLCDEVHEFAYNNAKDMAFVWPLSEAPLGFTANLSNGNDTYKFNTSSVDPCTQAGSPCTCTPVGSCTPKFPAPTSASSGGFGIAANNPSSLATLWGALPQSNFASGTSASTNWGQLFAYKINSDASLTWIWDGVHGDGNGGGKCSSPPINGWFVPSFTEPSLAAWMNNTTQTRQGAVYVPTACVMTGSTLYQSCYAARNDSGIASGVAVFTTCP